MVEHRFILKNSEILRNKPHSFSFGLFSFVTFYRSYSRLKHDGSNENWFDVVLRVTEGIFSIKKNYILKHGLKWNEDEMQRFALDFTTAMYDKKWLPSGRGLWIMEIDYIFERGSAALYNCAAVYTSDLADATK